MFKPILGITMGDPASIGPEITVKALARSEVYENCRPLVVGDACMMEKALKLVGHEEIKIHPVSDVKEALFTPGTIDVYDLAAAEKLFTMHSAPYFSGVAFSRDGEYAVGLTEEGAVCARTAIAASARLSAIVEHAP